ncbi:MAG: ABC transporter permease [Ilumatobacteraceae bacterium]|jgi:putative spermidine/putrescine transport system permease protein
MTAVIPPVEHVVPQRAAARSGRRFRIGPNLVLLFCGLFFLLPLLAMARFALQNVPVIRLGWSTLFDKWSVSGITKAFHDADFRDALMLSAKLAVGTVALTLGLLLPTAIWVHLRVPRARAFIEFLTVLPYVVPAIALVAGIKVIQPHVRWFLNSDYSLIPFYVVLALPFTYRSLDAGIRALDLRTLVDASRSLGAGWGTTLRRALVPNLRTAIISSAFLTSAVVLGEYTIANVLLRNTLPTFTQFYRATEIQGSYGLALLTLVATTGLFALLSVLTRPRGRQQKPEVPASTVIGVEPAPVSPDPGNEEP